MWADYTRLESGNDILVNYILYSTCSINVEFTEMLIMVRGLAQRLNNTTLAISGFVHTSSSL